MEGKGEKNWPAGSFDFRKIRRDAEREELSILNAMAEAVVLHDADLRILWANRAAEEAWGLKLQDMKGKFCFAAVCGRQEPCDGCPLPAARDTGTPGEAEVTFGDKVWHIRAFPIRDADGSVSKIVRTGRDITGAKAAEKALLEKQQTIMKSNAELNLLFHEIEKSKLEWEATLDCLGDMVILVNMNGRVDRCNRAFCKLTGRDYGQILGAQLKDLFAPMGAGIENLDMNHGEVISVSGRWFSVNMYPFRLAGSSRVSGSIVTLHDITEMKNISRDLEKAYGDLKAAQSQILQQEKMASIGQLAAGVAHEINNPVGFIMSNLGSLGTYLDNVTAFLKEQSAALRSAVSRGAADETRDETQRLEKRRKDLKIDFIIEDTASLIKESLDGAERVKKIVQDLKSFSHVDEAQQKPADINEGLESTINIVWNELKYKATLKRDYGDIPITRCNLGQLNQVFMNLLVNAAQAMEKQGEITVKTWLEDGNIRISISDTGCGIPRENLKRIFEPFFTTKEVGRGTGLGLSIAYDIIKKHDGKIEAGSEVGKGATFTITIPVRD